MVGNRKIVGKLLLVAFVKLDSVNGQKRHSNNQLLQKDGQVRPSLCQNRRSRFIWAYFSVGFVGVHSAAKNRGKKRVASCPRDFVPHNPSPSQPPHHLSLSLSLDEQ